MLTSRANRAARNACVGEERPLNRKLVGPWLATKRCSRMEMHVLEFSSGGFVHKFDIAADLVWLVGSRSSENDRIQRVRAKFGPVTQL